MVIVGTSRLTHPTCPDSDVRTGLVPDRLRSCCPAMVRPPGSAPQGASTRGAEDVVSERTGLQRGAAAQRPEEGPASLRCVQAIRRGVQGRTPAGEPAPRVGGQNPAPGDNTQ